MTTPFDPYHRWLAVPPGRRPPTFYQLLGVAPTEDDPGVIEEAALRQASHVRTYQTGPHAEACTAVLNEIGQARATLLNPDRRRAYDAGLTPPPPPPDTTVWGPVEEPSPAPRRRRDGGGAALALALYAALLLGAGLLGYWGLLRPAPPKRPTPAKRKAADGRPGAAPGRGVRA